MQKSLPLLVLLLACLGCPVTPPSGADCPPGATLTEEGGCACGPGTYGSLTLDAATGGYVGACLSGLEEALRTGNPETLDSEAEILAEAEGELADIQADYELLLRSIYRDEPITYDPSGWSHHLLSARPEDTYVLVECESNGTSTWLH